MSHDFQSDKRPATEARKLPGTDQDRPIQTAIDDFKGILSADGALDGDEDRLDLVRLQLESLAIKAQRSGWLYEGSIRLRIGGVEHDVVPDLDSRTVLKFTKPNRAAYAVNSDLGTPSVVPATPLEYLDRLHLQNLIFGDNLRFVGIAGTEGQRRIVTRQDIVSGKPAWWDDIVRMMTDLGFSKLRHNHGIGYEDSYAFLRDDVVVFDLRPANVFVTDDGIVVPIDCIPVRLPRGKRAFFEK